MTIDLIVQLNILGLLILTIILFNLNSLSKSDVVERIFIALFFISFITLAADTSSYFITDHSSQLKLIIDYLLVIIVFAGSMTPFILWLLMIFKEVYIPVRLYKKYRTILIAIWAINLLLLILNPVTGLMFKNVDGVFEMRTMVIFIYQIINMILVYTGIIVLARRQDRVPRSRFIGLILFVVPNALGIVLQSFLSEYVSYWTGVSLGVLILYLSIISSHNKKDHVTGLFRQNYILNILKDYEQEKIGYLLCLFKLKIPSSMDNYKSIQKENILIKNSADFFNNTFSDIGTLSRYSKNAFLLLIRISESYEIEELQSHILENSGKKEDLEIAFYVNEFDQNKIQQFLENDMNPNKKESL